ncbi:CRISPR-associated exonuclease, Cas4 family [Cruoricaptor ignavus]|uniref:CRISPR-associated exonuclease Cas4 n=1 Tax=Cruoricaptor ignavus TaxID=1118202 RepID=A0A1M6DKI8_9FLAO|nr:CRISPR-associated protein Cas4 [Cruoricaptor ignavus]SHI73735.1 CRISPR-associated exonuclease, Cas4 family [Cruoricaptor ignavus]
MVINATLVSYYIYCKRRMWLHANNIRMEQNSDLVAEGKLIGENTYQQRPAKYSQVELSYQYSKEILLSSKIDFYDAKNKIVHEVKKSSSKEASHEWQVRFYLWMLKLNNIPAASGIIEYPKFRDTTEVQLSEEYECELRKMTDEISKILNSETVPGKIEFQYCKKCSYFEFCYSSEL